MLAPRHKSPGFWFPLALCRGVMALVAACALLWASASRAEGPAQPEPRTQDAAILGTTNLEALSGAYLHLQQQVHAARLALEQNRQEAERTAAANAELMANQLRTIEQSLAAQRAREFEEIQRSNRLMLTLAAVFAGIGLLTLMGLAYFQWHTVNRLTGLSTVPVLGPGRSIPRLALNGAAFGAAEGSGQANGHWKSTLAQLEQRIEELEQAARPSLNPAAPAPNEPGTPASEDPVLLPPAAEGNQPQGAARAKMLLGKGQSLLNMGRPADALECFQEAVAIEPNNAEALVKQGTALEQLENLDEALASYDRAIEADRSMTIAYLRKGGLFNRRQLFKEALECYELALHTGTKRNS